MAERESGEVKETDNEKGIRNCNSGSLAAAGAFLSDKLGILYPVLCVLMG